MSFFTTALGRILRVSDNEFGAEQRSKLYEAWGLSDTAHPEFPEGQAPAADPAEMAAPAQASPYDRDKWERKLRTVLDGLPDSEDQFDSLLQEAAALGFEDDWVRRRQREEFGLLLRRAVADRRVTPQEHRQLDLARTLIGITENEAEEQLRAIVAEAETIFGGRVEGAEVDRPAGPGPT